MKQQTNILPVFFFICLINISCNKPKPIATAEKPVIAQTLKGNTVSFTNRSENIFGFDNSNVQVTSGGYRQTITGLSNEDIHLAYIGSCAKKSGTDSFQIFLNPALKAGLDFNTVIKTGNPSEISYDGYDSIQAVNIGVPLIFTYTNSNSIKYFCSVNKVASAIITYSDIDTSKIYESLKCKDPNCDNFIVTGIVAYEINAQIATLKDKRFNLIDLPIGSTGFKLAGGAYATDGNTHRSKTYKVEITYSRLLQ